MSQLLQEWRAAQQRREETFLAELGTAMNLIRRGYIDYGDWDRWERRERGDSAGWLHEH
jgi:hypothetical protein